MFVMQHRFSDKLTIVVSQGVNFTISLSAEGSGTTIVSHPPLQPGVDLGPHFSRSMLQQRFTLTNRYVRSYTVYCQSIKKSVVWLAMCI